jgi:hypothetical protein
MFVQDNTTGATLTTNGSTVTVVFHGATVTLEAPTDNFDGLDEHAAGHLLRIMMGAGLIWRGLSLSPELLCVMGLMVEEFQLPIIGELAEIIRQAKALASLPPELAQLMAAVPELAEVLLGTAPDDGS